MLEMEISKHLFWLAAKSYCQLEILLSRLTQNYSDIPHSVAYSNFSFTDEDF